MLKVNADIGVLVTAVYPNDMKRMGFVEGIWVCSVDEFKGSATLLRESLIRVHQTLQKEDNKADKMTLLSCTCCLPVSLKPYLGMPFSGLLTIMPTTLASLSP